MAKIKYSGLVAEMRNKLNGSVLSKNRYGNYMRTKVTPVNPQTSFQQAARAALGAMAQSWRGLTQAARNSWNALAPTIPFTDIFGDIKYLSGSALFTKFNSNLVKIGQPVNTAAPQPVEIPAFLAVSLNAETDAGTLDDLTLEASAATIPAGFSVAVYATPPVPASISFVKNRFRFIGIAPAFVAGESDIQSLYEARFGTVAPAGQRIFVRMALVANATGQQGVPSEAIGVITA